MRKVIFFVVVAAAVLAQVPAWSQERGEKKQTVKLIVRSSLLPGFVSDVKSGKRITDVEVKPAKAKKANLSEVIKGKDDMPPTGDYHFHKILIAKGKTYNTHEAYLSAALVPGTKLTGFVYKGTFTGVLGGEKHKYTYCEATAAAP